MKTILTLALTFFTVQSFANSFTLRKGLPAFPQEDIELSKIWEDCINQAQKISFASGYAYLENSSHKCVQIGLEHIPFKQNGRSYMMDLPREVNPFSKLENVKVTLTAFYLADFSQMRVFASNDFVPDLNLDIRLSTTKSGIPYDYFISKKESIVGWEKVNQVLVSTEQRTELCRPGINCTFILKTYNQTWKHKQSGQVFNKTITEYQ